MGATVQKTLCSFPMNRRRFREHQTSLLDCMELLLEEKETKESQPESVEALLDTEEYTEAYY